MLRLDFEKSGLDDPCPSKSPQQARQSEHQLPLHSRLRIVIGGNGCFEGFVIFSILQRAYHCFGRQPVADGIAARSVRSSFRLRTCALEGVATVGLELFDGGHWRPISKNGFVLMLCSSPLARCGKWMAFQPQGTRGNGRIDAQLSPPCHFIATAVDLAMMATTQGNRELIADFAAKRP